MARIAITSCVYPGGERAVRGLGARMAEEDGAGGLAIAVERLRS